MLCALSRILSDIGTLISSLCGFGASSARGRWTVVSGSSGVKPAPRGRGAGSSFDCGIGGRSLVLFVFWGGLVVVIPDERVDVSEGPFVRPGMLRLHESGAEMVVLA